MLQASGAKSGSIQSPTVTKKRTHRRKSRNDSTKKVVGVFKAELRIQEGQNTERDTEWRKEKKEFARSLRGGRKEKRNICRQRKYIKPERSPPSSNGEDLSEEGYYLARERGGEK